MGTTQGPEWLALKPAHFDAGLLPRKHRKHRKHEPEGLFSVADIAPAAPKASPAGEMDGQPDLFSLIED